MRCLLLVAAAGCATGAANDKMEWSWHPPPPAEIPLAAEHPCDAPPAVAEPEVQTIQGAGGPADYEPAELETVRHLPVVAPALEGPRSLAFGWPMPTTGINSLFGARKDPIDGSTRFHYGVDLDGLYGAPVATAAAGTVIYAGWSGGHGRTVVIDHDGGFRTSYSHLAQTLVHAGSWVQGGEAVGLLGNSGRSTGPHLHFEVTRFGDYLDPLELLGTSIPID
jgi:murein DD-endopeptidase MepM/ murein hydrolase activator NlpD